MHVCRRIKSLFSLCVKMGADIPVNTINTVSII